MMNVMTGSSIQNIDVYDLVFIDSRPELHRDLLLWEGDTWLGAGRMKPGMPMMRGILRFNATDVSFSPFEEVSLWSYSASAVP